MGYLALFLWLAGMVIAWQILETVNQLVVKKLLIGEKLVASALWPILAILILIG